MQVSNVKSRIYKEIKCFIIIINLGFYNFLGAGTDHPQAELHLSHTTEQGQAKDLATKESTLTARQYEHPAKSNNHGTALPYAFGTSANSVNQTSDVGWLC